MKPIKSMMLKEQDVCFWRCRFCIWDDIRKWPVCKLNGRELHRDEKIPEWCPIRNGQIKTSDIFKLNDNNMEAN
jgi:hypothetical protein